MTFMRRTATGDVRLGDYEFSDGDRMVLFYNSANRDPRRFTDPEAFDVLRSPNPHVGFGGPGPHFCLGAHLARRELADGRRFLAGDAFTVADITAMAALRLGDLMQAVVPADLTHAKRWESTVRDRPSWRA